MKETELKEVMNEIVNELYVNCRCNIVTARSCYKDFVESGSKDSYGAMQMARESAFEDLRVIHRLAGGDYSKMLADMPSVYDYDEVVTRWWE